jgi:PAS domain S-box-containing protein
MKSTSAKIRFTKGVSFSIKIATIYFVLGVLWILLSDKILGVLVRDPTVLTDVSVVKGWFYVSVTALMLYVLIRRGVSQIEHSGKEALLSEAKYRELVESANSIIMRRDVTGHITFFNEFAQDFFGYSKDEILGRNVIGTIVPEVERSGRDLKEMIEDIGKHPERYTNNENENMRANGERVWIAWTNKPIRDEHGQITEILCIGNDITERKRAENALLESENKFKSFAEQAITGINIIQDGVFKYLNPKCAQMFGYNVDECLNDMPFKNLVCAEDLATVEEQVRRRVSGEAESVHYTFRGLKKNGQIFPVEIYGSAIVYQGMPAATGTILDITERKRAEKALEENEVRLKIAMDLAKLVQWEYDVKTGMFSFDDQFYALYGTTSQHEGGPLMTAEAYVRKFIPPDESHLVAEEIAKVLATTDPNCTGQLEHRIIRADGEERHIILRCGVVCDQTGRVVKIRGANQDVTLRAKQTREIEHLNRLYSVLSRVSQAVVRATSPETFLELACREIVEGGGFLLAWIGHVELMTNAVVPSALWGEIGDYLQGITVHADSGPEGRGPTGTCIHRHRPIVYNDFLHDLQTLPWHDRAAPFGIAAAAAFPIERAGGVWGALTIYSDEVDRFSDEDVKLLDKVAGDIGFALDNLDREFRRKQAEDALLESENKFKSFAEQALAGIYILQDGVFKYVNSKFAQMFGYTVEECLNGMSFKNLVYAADLTMVEEQVRRRVSGEVQFVQYTFRGLKKNGQIFPVEVYGATSVHKGKPAGTGTILDIAERKRAEDELRLHAERVQALLNLNQMTDATLQEITDYALEGAVRLTQSKIGYLAFLNDDETILTMHSWSKQAMHECAITNKPIHYNVRETGLWGESVRQRRMVITNDYAAPNPLKKGCPTGHVAVQRHMNVPVFVGPHIVLVAGVGNKKGDYDENDAQQLTLFMEGMWRLIERKRGEEERKKLEGQLFQAQKMESVGRLAGGVAHDFNNMLGVIIGRAEMALEQDIPIDKLQENLKEILKAGLRSADLTRQLLAFARKQTAAPKILDLNDTISGMLKLLRRLIGEDIELFWAPELDLWKVKIDPSQVDQILANLLVNGRDAISGVGAITMKTENVVIDESNRAEPPEFIPGDYVKLTVADTGAGMSQEVRENIFEPFFTTKELGMGTGLGLSTVYGIVKQNDGFIYVASELGKGTTFKIYLPRFEAETLQVDDQEATGKPPTGTETILVVEDDEAILKLSKIILENLGYTVLAAQTPVHAIHLVEEYPEDIHLLITDVVMPEMNGRDLAKHLSASRSNLKCLYMSGYTADLIAHRGILDERLNFIQKPFVSDEFAAKVRQVLDHLGIDG